MTFWIYFHNIEKYISRVCYGECYTNKLLQKCQPFILIRIQDKSFKILLDNFGWLSFRFFLTRCDFKRHIILLILKSSTDFIKYKKINHFKGVHFSIGLLTSRLKSFFLLYYFSIMFKLPYDITEKLTIFQQTMTNYPKKIKT